MDTRCGGLIQETLPSFVARCRGPVIGLRFLSPRILRLGESSALKNRYIVDMNMFDFTGEIRRRSGIYGMAAKTTER